MDIEEDGRPRLVLNKAAWRVSTVVATVVALALVVVLLVQSDLGSDQSPGKKDPLTTLALVLAVMAFLVQIFVYVFQSNASSRAIERAEELNVETQGLLNEIRTNSQATQRVLFSQFDRLLDYVVQGTPPANGEAEDQVTGSSETTMPDEGTDPSARQPRFFSAYTTGGPSEEDRRVLAYLRSWPTEEEARKAVGILERISPLAQMRFKRFVDRELAQRFRGERVGLAPATIFSHANEELIEAGLLREDDDRQILTDSGRDAGRLVGAIVKATPAPPWLETVMAPLIRR